MIKVIRKGVKQHAKKLKKIEIHSQDTALSRPKIRITKYSIIKKLSMLFRKRSILKKAESRSGVKVLGP